MADALLAATPPPVETPPPATPGAPPPAPPAGSSPTPPTDWRAGLPPELQQHKGLEKFKGDAPTVLGALAKSYVEMEAFRGRSVVFPGADAKPEERAAFEAKIHAAMGVPDAPDKYEIAAPEGRPSLDDGAVNHWKGVFHRLAFTPDQVKGLTSAWWDSPMGNPEMANDALQAQAVQMLRNEWGGSYDYNLKMASHGARTVLGAEFTELLVKTGLANHPAIVKRCLQLGNERKEHGMLPVDAKTGGIMDPDGAAEKIRAIRSDPKHPWHSGDKAARDEMDRLYELAGGPVMQQR